MGERRHREHVLLPILVAVVAVGTLVWWIRDEHDLAAERVRYEDLALERVRRLAQAELAYHERNGRYGWLTDLEQAGLTAGLELETAGRVRRVASPRYRIDLLLPHAVIPGNYVRIATRAEVRADAELAQKHFAVVARPWGDELTGFRTFYIDETKHVFVSEGVSDVPSRRRRPLPDLHLTKGRPPTNVVPRDVAGLHWWSLDHLPPR